MSYSILVPHMYSLATLSHFTYEGTGKKKVEVLDLNHKESEGTRKCFKMSLMQISCPEQATLIFKGPPDSDLNCDM